MLMIIVFPVLLFIIGYTLFRFFKLFTTGDTVHLKIIAGIWFLPFILIVAAIINKPVSLSKNDIVGTYEVDSEFYPGDNADWQKQLFSFVITENDEFWFFERLADGSYKQIKGDLQYYRNAHPMLYRIVLDHPHKLIDEYPTLYRQRFGFYYVFDSAFGNMFYRKVSSSTQNKAELSP